MKQILEITGPGEWTPVTLFNHGFPFLAWEPESMAEQHQPEVTLPDVAVVTRDDTNETVAVLILKGGYNSIKVHKALKAKHDIPDNVYLNSRLIGTEEVPGSRCYS